MNDSNPNQTNWSIESSPGLPGRDGSGDPGAARPKHPPGQAQLPLPHVKPRHGRSLGPEVSVIL